MASTTTSTQIVALVKEVAGRMRNPETVKNIVMDPQNRNPKPLYPEFEQHWGDLAIAGGYPGILLLFAELDRLFPDEKWDDAAHAYVLKIKASIESNGIQQFSLYGGLPGACFALQHASRGGTRYQKLLATLNRYLLENVNEICLAPIREWLKKRQPSMVASYDLISGIVGIGVYCLSQLKEEPVAELAKEIARLSVGLTQPLHAHGKEVPGWYVPSEYQFLDEEKKRYPKGNFNLGLAHGVPGVLGYLAAASLHGIHVDGQKEAIERVTTWIQNTRRESDKGFFWDTTITFEEEGLPTTGKRPFIGRDAWCYGTPGVAATLLISGKALKDERLKNYALDSFRGVFSRSREEWFLPGPTFCHGISGLLLITHQLAQEKQASDLKKQTARLTEYLLEYYHPEHPFGFKNYEPSQDGYAEIDRVDILEGSSGILLTLLSLHHPSSWWHAPFLISAGK